MKNKLALQLIATIVVIITLITGILMPIYLYLQPKLFIEQEKHKMAVFSQRMKSVEPFDRESLKEFTQATGSLYRVYVIDEDLNPIYTSFQLGYQPNFVKNLFQNKLNRFKPNAEPHYVRLEDEPAVRLYTSHVVDGEKYYIHINYSLRSVTQTFDFSNKILGGVVAAFLVICSVALWLVISPSIKTVRNAIGVAKNISENNLSVRYQGRIPRNEIGDLALSINKMADTIQENINDLENYNFVLREDNRHMMEYEESRRMLLRNITHDLKTPLAVISSQVEMISTCKDPEKKEYYYQSAMEEIGKMSKMLTDVLKMTVTEHDMITQKSQHFDISELIDSLCDSNHAYVQSRHLELNRKITPGLSLCTIKEYVEFVFRNYLSNAVQNASKNSAITVTLEKSPYGIRLSVENQGSCISDELKDKID